MKARATSTSSSGARTRRCISRSAPTRASPSRPSFLDSSFVTTRSASQEERRQQILDAAVRAFARKGYHASRVSDIADEAGVADGLVYPLFVSEEARAR